MSLDILSLAVGGGALGVGFLLGVFATLVLRPAAQPPREPNPYVCGCTHALALHDPETNRCNATVEVQKYNQFNSRAGIDRKPCACRQYVGERPVDPDALIAKFAQDHPTLPPAPQDRT